MAKKKASSKKASALKKTTRKKPAAKKSITKKTRSPAGVKWAPAAPGDWDFDPAKHPAYADPKKLWRRIETDEQYRLVADYVATRKILVINGDTIVDKDGNLIDLYIDDLSQFLSATMAYDIPTITIRQCVLRTIGDRQTTPSNITIQSLALNAFITADSRVGNITIKGNVALYGLHALKMLSIRSLEVSGTVGIQECHFHDFFGIDSDSVFYSIIYVDDSYFHKALRVNDSTFHHDAWICYTNHYGYIDFYGCVFHRPLYLLSTVLGRGCPIEFTDTTFESSLRIEESVIHGKLDFLDTNIHERLSLAGTFLSRHARLSMQSASFQSGATFSLSSSQLTYEQQHIEQRLRSHDLTLIRINPALPIIRRMLLWVGCIQPLARAEGDSSSNPGELLAAAETYDALAIQYRMQSSTDWEEDWCRWRAHENRRLAALQELRNDTKDFLTSDYTPSERLRGYSLQTRWCLEYLELMWQVVCGYAVLIPRWIKQIGWDWLVRRTAIGYLLQTHRIIVAGIALMIGFALIYQVFIGPSDIGHGHFAPELVNGEYRHVEAYDYWKSDRLNPLYLSLMTFVTLGYGDFQPAAGWLKLVTGLEGLLGVTLLALFTVAWGRKMIR